MIYLCDFDDSFTYNIYADLKTLGHDVTIISFNEVYQFLQTKISSKEKEVIILGPGPGHPEEYNFLNSSIKSLIQRENLLLVGICLGHQLIWQALGNKCVHCKTPLHGQVQEIIFNQKKQLVQRYNSLCIQLDPSEVNQWATKGWKLSLDRDELMHSSNENVITYQFHPESVGTSCPELFYGPVNKFLL
jgi:anthranilate/para-aminobenzoate synthase component II